MASLADFRGESPTWCPGCGDFGVLSALQKAAVTMGLSPDELVVIAGIGCSGKIASFFNSYGFHGVHGRTLPVATAVKLANRDLTVIAAGGDGDGYGIGLSHFIHAMRRNIDVTYIVMDNLIYGLTKGQTSPTSKKGAKTKSTPTGSAEEPVRPLELALATNVSWLGQGFSGDVRQLARLVQEAVEHKGFSLLNVCSPCVTFNKEQTYDFFRESLINLDEEEDYQTNDRIAAMRKIMETDGLVRGVIYKTDNRPSYEHELPGFKELPLVESDLSFSEDEFEEIVKQF